MARAEEGKIAGRPNAAARVVGVAKVIE